LDVNSATKLHQKQISPNSRSGLQQSLREAILGGSGGSSNGDANIGVRDMVRIGKFRNQLKYHILDSYMDIYKMRL
jgi:hypothetical protein